MKKYHHICQGTCSRAIDITLNDDDTVADVVFTGGCSGNTQGVARLAIGRKRLEIIALLKGVSCSGGPTSCPDQLAQALEQMG